MARLKTNARVVQILEDTYMIVEHPGWWRKKQICQIDPKSPAPVGVCLNGALAIAAGIIEPIGFDKETDELIYNLDKAIGFGFWERHPGDYVWDENLAYAAHHARPGDPYDLGDKIDLDFARAGRYVLDAMNRDLTERGILPNFDSLYADMAEGNDAPETTQDDIIRWAREAARKAKRNLKRQKGSK